MKKAERIIASLLMIFCGIYFYMSCAFSVESRLFPHILIISLFVSSIILLINSYHQKKKKIRLEEIQKKIILPRLFGTITISLLYIFFINIIGFYVMTIVYLLALMYFLGINKLKTLLAVSIISTLILYLGFRTFLEVPTPKGILF